MALDSLPTDTKDPAYAPAILEYIRAGNFEVDWASITNEANGHTAEFRVFADALKIEGVRVSVSATLQQQIADTLGCMLLTPRLADLIWQQRAVTLVPQTRTITSMKAAMIDNSALIDKQLAAQNNPAGLRCTVGKHWVIDNALLQHKGKAENYGWHVPSWDSTDHWHGIWTAPCATMQSCRVIQDPGWAHDPSHLDYSQICVLVSRTCIVDGAVTDLEAVLTSAEYAPLASHQGPLTVLRQPGVSTEPVLVRQPPCVGPNCPKLVSWGPGGDEFNPSTDIGLLALSGIALVFVVGGFLGGMALLGRHHENPRFPKELEHLIETARASGWSVELTKKNHVRFQSPTGQIVIAAGSPSDWREVLNTRSRLRRAGLKVR